MRHRTISSRSDFPYNILNNLRNHEASRQALSFIIIALASLSAYPSPDYLIFGTISISLGLCIRLLASGTIIKNKQLCRDGLYQMIRHPLYAGNILILFGFVAFSNSPSWYLIFIFFILFYYPPAINYEDNKLEYIYGEEWSSWSSITPALIPRKLTLSNLLKHWSIQKSFVYNGEPIIVIYVLLWLYTMH